MANGLPDTAPDLKTLLTDLHLAAIEHAGAPDRVREAEAAREAAADRLTLFKHFPEFRAAMSDLVGEPKTGVLIGGGKRV